VDEAVRAQDEGPVQDEGPIYAFRPRLIGPAYVFRLGPDSLEWQMGNRPGRVAYPMIARLRLGFRFSTFMGRRYTAEVFPRQGGRFEIASTSARSVFDNSDQGAAFRAFVTELHRKIGPNAGCRFEAGMAAWRWWPSAAVTAALLVAVLFVALRAVLDAQVVPGLIVLAVGVLFLWQMGMLLLRNRPRTYAPDAIPEDVLPK
jgi:hypothetical protein